MSTSRITCTQVELLQKVLHSLDVELVVVDDENLTLFVVIFHGNLRRYSNLIVHCFVIASCLNNNLLLLILSGNAVLSNLIALDVSLVA